jgi:hypothetical protein
MDGLELHLTPLHYFQKCFLHEKEDKLRSHLSNFGIAGELAMHPMYTLSGGQKGRVAFAKVCAPTLTGILFHLVHAMSSNNAQTWECISLLPTMCPSLPGSRSVHRPVTLVLYLTDAQSPTFIPDHRQCSVGVFLVTKFEQLDKCVMELSNCG